MGFQPSPFGTGRVNPLFPRPKDVGFYIGLKNNSTLSPCFLWLCFAFFTPQLLPQNLQKWGLALQHRTTFQNVQLRKSKCLTSSAASNPAAFENFLDRYLNAHGLALLYSKSYTELSRYHLSPVLCRGILLNPDP